MPVDMAVEEPRTRIVRREANRDVVPRPAHANHVALRWVREVVTLLTGGAHDGEDVAVQVDWVRSSNGPGREGELDDFVRGDLEERAFWKQLLRSLGSAEDLQEDRNLYGCKSTVWRIANGERTVG